MTPVRFRRSDGATLTVVLADRQFVCNGLGQRYPLLVQVDPPGRASYWCDLDGDNIARELFDHCEIADESDHVPQRVIDQIEDAFTSAANNETCERIGESAP